MNGTQLNCGLTNTFMLAADTLYYLAHPRYAALGHCNLRNLGDGNIWYRMDGQDAVIGDPGCILLPATYDDVDVSLHGQVSLITESSGKKPTALVVRCY